MKEVEKVPFTFNVENEIRKLKIPVPLTELLKANIFTNSILKILQPTGFDLNNDTIDL